MHWKISKFDSRCSNFSKDRKSSYSYCEQCVLEGRNVGLEAGFLMRMWTSADAEPGPFQSKKPKKIGPTSHLTISDHSLKKNKNQGVGN